MVKERRENYSDTYMKFVILGITLCVLAEIPLFCIAMIEVNDFYAVVALSVMLAIVAIGVFFIVKVSINSPSVAICGWTFYVMGYINLKLLHCENKGYWNKLSIQKNSFLR